MATLTAAERQRFDSDAARLLAYASALLDGEIELTPFTAADTEWFASLPGYREIAWEFGWGAFEARRHIAARIASASERGIGAFFRVRVDGDDYGMVWAVPRPSGRVALSGFEIRTGRPRRDSPFEREDVVVRVLRMLETWAARLGEPYITIPCRDSRLVDFYTRHGFYWRSNFGERRHVAAEKLE